MSTPDQRGAYHVEQRGAEPGAARAAMILIHGRGASARDILSLTQYFERDDLIYLAPEAPGNQWYPWRFMEPIERNEPGITRGMQAIDDVFTTLRQSGLSAERTVILGFSQGACLAVEYVARHAQRYGGVVGLSGGLIGPDGTPRDYQGSLAGTPVFLGCSDIDPHIPVQRVHETGEVLGRLGGEVTKQIYPGMGHTVTEDEIEHINRLLTRI